MSNYVSANLKLSELQQYIFAYYLATGARDIDMTPRFWPYAELLEIIEDKVMLGVRKFGITSSVTCRPVASALLDLLIEQQGFSTVTGSLGEKMHRYQSEYFRKSVDQLIATNPIIQEAQSASPDFWQAAFAQPHR